MKWMMCVDYIRSDYYRIKGDKEASLAKMLLYTSVDIGFRFMFWFRFAKWDSWLNIIPRVVYRHLSLKHKIEIERITKIGYGFQIKHGGPVVINSSTVIGNNVDIYQNSTIGSSHLNGANVGDSVYIGPGVCVVEGVSIGNGATIGAGAVVVTDVEAGCTVAGNPARVISHKTPGRLVWRRWDRSWNKVK